MDVVAWKSQHRGTGIRVAPVPPELRPLGEAGQAVTLGGRGAHLGARCVLCPSLATPWGGSATAHQGSAWLGLSA